MHNMRDRIVRNNVSSVVLKGQAIEARQAACKQLGHSTMIDHLGISTCNVAHG